MIPFSPWLRRYPLVVVSLFLLGLPPSVGLHGQTPLPAGGESLLSGDFTAVHTFRTGLENTSREVVDVDGPTFTQAIRVTQAGDPGSPWDIELAVPVNQAVAAGDVGLLRFWMRAVETFNEESQAYLQPYVQRASSPWTKSLYLRVGAGQQWTEILLPFTFVESYGAGQAAVVIGAGGWRQTVEIGGVEAFTWGKQIDLEDLPQPDLSYPGIEPNAPWRAAAAQRIAEHRQGPLALEVVSPYGVPLPGVELDATMTRHAFPFGTAVKPYLLVENSSDAARYREELLRLFNAAGTENALKWPAWAGEWGSTRYGRQTTFAGLEWLADNNLSTRGHVLVWPGWDNLPNSLRPLENDPDALRQAVLSHIDEITQAVKPWVHEWDVINEPYHNYDLMDILGEEEMAVWFARARTNLPEAGLYLNDFGILVDDAAHQDAFAAFIEKLLAWEAPITGLGMQGHFSGIATGPERMLAILDRFAAYGLDIRITEYDYTVSDQQLQAAHLRDALTICFSHPSVVGFQFWGFWAGAHWRPDTALFAEDWSPRPALAAYEELVFDTWWTDGESMSGWDGSFAFRGTYGDYDLVLTGHGHRVELAYEHRAGQPVTTYTWAVGQPWESAFFSRFPPGTVTPWDSTWMDVHGFGYVAPLDFPWLRHAEHGWLLVHDQPPPETGQGMLLWSPETGWWWTSLVIYPAIYSFTEGAWLWYRVGSGLGGEPREFVRLDDGSLITLP